MPRDLVERLGLTEVRRSLGVGRLTDARIAAPLLATRVKKVFEMIAEHPNWTEGKAQAVLNSVFDSLAAETTPAIVARCGETEYEREYQRMASLLEVFALDRQIAAGQLDEGLKRRTNRILVERNVGLDGLPDDELWRLQIGVARALVERQRLFQFRLDDAVLPYRPIDPLFQAEPPPAARNTETPVGPTLGTLVERYKLAKKSSWTAKTYSTNSAKLQFLVDFFGAERPASSIQPGEVVTYSDGIFRLRKHHHVGAGRSFSERQTDDHEGRIAPKTARLIFETTRAFFRWSRGRHYLAVNPADGIELDLPKQKKKTPPRRPFNSGELVALFSGAPFSSFRSARRLMEAGKMTVRGAHFWIPTIGYYTGMRLGEIVQLHLEDIHFEGPIPFIDVNEAVKKGVEKADHKHVKSLAGVRQVPLHPDVMALGFRTFVQRRRKSPRAGNRLFWEIGYGADGQPSTLFSKWFGRLLDARGLSDPAIVFHSFRHTMEDALRNKLVPQYVIDRIIGHSPGTVSSSYGEGISLQVAAGVLAEAELPVSVPALLAGQA